MVYKTKNKPNYCNPLCTCMPRVNYAITYMHVGLRDNVKLCPTLLGYSAVQLV